MAKIDYEYGTTEERIRAYLRVPEIDRRRWFEEPCAFTSLVRQAPITHSAPHLRRTTGADPDASVSLR